MCRRSTTRLMRPPSACAGLRTLPVSHTHTGTKNIKQAVLRSLQQGMPGSVGETIDFCRENRCSQLGGMKKGVYDVATVNRCCRGRACRAWTPRAADAPTRVRQRRRWRDRHWRPLTFPYRDERVNYLHGIAGLGTAGLWPTVLPFAGGRFTCGICG